MNDATCSVDDCGGKVLARGWCSTHYARWFRKGDPQAAYPPPEQAPVSLPGERWLPVVGYEGYYAVSDLGRVLSLYRKGLILRPSRAGSMGYLFVTLYANGRRRQCYVHRLVAAAFIGPCPAGQETRHGPNGALDNRASQLCYGTSRENNGPDKARDGTNARDCCKHKHEYTPENTITEHWPDGTFKLRRCRQCVRDIGARRRARDAAGGKPSCTEDGCDAPQVAKGICRRHYQQQWEAAQVKGAA